MKAHAIGEFPVKTDEEWTLIIDEEGKIEAHREDWFYLDSLKLGVDKAILIDEKLKNLVIAELVPDESLPGIRSRFGVYGLIEPELKPGVKDGQFPDQMKNPSRVKITVPHVLVNMSKYHYNLLMSILGEGFGEGPKIVGGNAS